jgi:parallel beta-helix repeat protein
LLNRILAAAILLAAPALAAARQVDIRSLGVRCDGRTDDGPKIQQALNRLRTGDVLVVSCRAGIGGAGLVLRDRRNVVIRGVNGGGFKALAPANLAAQGFSPVMFLVQGCVRCSVESLYFEMNRTPEAAIGFDRCAESTLKGNTVQDGGYPAPAAIVATGNRLTRYLENRVLGTGHDDKDGARGMWIGNGGDQQEEFQPVVSGNTVDAAGATGIVVYGRGATVTANRVSRTKGAGIKLIVREFESRIADNTLIGNQFHGLQIERGEGRVHVERNTLQDNAIAGLYVSGGDFTGEIVDNRFSGNREAGIYLYRASGVTIRNNRFESGGHGILIEALQDNAIRAVEISGNSMRDQAQDGIAVWARGGELAGLRIDGNSFAGRMPVGLKIEDRGGRTSGQIALGANCFDRQLARSLTDQRSSALPSPSKTDCANTKNEGRPR